MLRNIYPVPHDAMRGHGRVDADKVRVAITASKCKDLSACDVYGVGWEEALRRPLSVVGCFINNDQTEIFESPHFLTPNR